MSPALLTHGSDLEHRLPSLTLQSHHDQDAQLMSILHPYVSTGNNKRRSAMMPTIPTTATISTSPTASHFSRMIQYERQKDGL